MVCLTRYETLHVLGDVPNRSRLVWGVSAFQLAYSGEFRSTFHSSRVSIPYTENEPSLANALVVAATKVYSHPCVPSSQDGFEKRFSETVTSVQVTTSRGLGGLAASASRAQRARESHRIEGAMAGAKRKNQRQNVGTSERASAGERTIARKEVDRGSQRKDVPR